MIDKVYLPEIWGNPMATNEEKIEAIRAHISFLKLRLREIQAEEDSLVLQLQKKDTEKDDTPRN